ncbi:SAM-dependent methyltransferase [Actinomadura scrupuli]|uniref:SAM-dependent methyltransferase n=1 Tax=Actinomadura scrupuli TaxID=559629 RepID=UPI003D954E01
MPGSAGSDDSLGFDPTTPNIARMYDYFLGGKDNFAADREAADQVKRLAPEVPMIARENRRFLDRVIRFLVDAGIRQFVDIGTGLPTQGHVHEILRSVAPDARVVYVDHDPVVIVHAQALLEGNGRAAVIGADLRRPDEILSDPRLTALIDLDQPVAFLLLAVLHFILDDDEAREILTQLNKSVPPGSHLAVSHAVPHIRPETREGLAAVYREGPMKDVKRPDQRSRSDIESLLESWDIIEPGIVHLPSWRPEPSVALQDPDAVWLVGGVARKS